MSAETTARALERIAEEAASDLDRPPTSGELLEILAWGLRSLPDDKVDGFQAASLTGLKAGYERGAKADRDSGEVAELSDAAFTEAADLLARLAKDLDGPALQELLDAVVEGLHEAGDDVLSDVKPAQVTKIEPQLRKSKQPKPKAGDLVAIPVDGAYELAVVVARNRFGTAYGLLGRRDTPRPVTANSLPDELPPPVYAGDDPVVEGRWRIVGHDEELLTRFPEEPEIFHPPRSDLPGDVGEHGAAEKPDGTLRKLSAEEAKEVGLDRDDFQAVYYGEDLEQRLASG